MSDAKEFEERLLRLGKDAIGKVLEVYKRRTRKGAERERLRRMEGIIRSLEVLLVERVPVKTPRRRAKITWHDKINQVAHSVAKANGWDVPDDLNLATSDNPRGRQFWSTAMIAYEGFFGDTLDLDAEIEEDS